MPLGTVHQIFINDRDFIFRAPQSQCVLKSVFCEFGLFLQRRNIVICNVPMFFVCFYMFLIFRQHGSIPFFIICFSSVFFAYFREFRQHGNAIFKNVRFSGYTKAQLNL